MEPSRVRCVV